MVFSFNKGCFLHGRVGGETGILNYHCTASKNKRKKYYEAAALAGEAIRAKLYIFFFILPYICKLPYLGI
jgi:hypothetical protein